MERMDTFKLVYTQLEVLNLVDEYTEAYKNKIEQLKEENKNLKERVSELEDVSKDYDLLSKDFIALGEENKNLKIEIGGVMGERDGLKMVVERLHKDIEEQDKEYCKLKEEIETLNMRLDNKEKLNEEYRKKIDELKLDLGECECSFLFENDEVGFWKREYKRLKKWIKDHCKGYGNLFPEDEMKRQWKKADKKRK